VVVVLEKLALMMLVLMMYRAIAFTFHLRLPPSLLSTFALRVITLDVWRTVIGWDVGWSTVSIAHGKDDG